MKRTRTHIYGVIILIGLAMSGLGQPTGKATKSHQRRIRLVRSDTLIVKSPNDCEELNRALGTEYLNPVIAAMVNQGRAFWLSKGEVVTVGVEEGRAPKDWLRVNVSTGPAKGAFWIPIGSLEGEAPPNKENVAAILIIVHQSGPQKK
jgi:hypothetical protein